MKYFIVSKNRLKINKNPKENLNLPVDFKILTKKNCQTKNLSPTSVFVNSKKRDFGKEIHMLFLALKNLEAGLWNLLHCEFNLCR